MTMVPGDIAHVITLPYSLSIEAWYEALRDKRLPQLYCSGDGSHSAGNVDFVCADPLAIVQHSRGRTQVLDCLDGSVREDDSPPFAALAACCPIQPRASEPELLFSGGAAGYFGYELLHGHNRIARALATEEDISAPDMLVGIYDWVIQRDHRRQQSRLIVRRTTPAREAAILATIQSLAQTPPVPRPREDFRLLSPFRSNFTRDQYLARFQRVIDYIHAGDCYQVNLAQCFTATCAGDGWQAFKQLQQRAQAPFAAFIEHEALQVLSFSPERFLRVRDGRVLTQPIKGTRPRGQDADQDLANRLNLEGSAKDRAENLMIVDLLRNDLGRVCRFGSVVVDKLFETQSFTNVHHLVSSISGVLERPEDVYRLIEAGFPGGSITGTPKIRAMEIIDELETRPRSVYCGVIGWVDCNGNMDSNIAIRTLVREGERIHAWGGGGLVADSQGADEYQETLDKISMFIDNL